MISYQNMNDDTFSNTTLINLPYIKRLSFAKSVKVGSLLFTRVTRRSTISKMSFFNSALVKSPYLKRLLFGYFYKIVTSIVLKFSKVIKLSFQYCRRQQISVSSPIFAILAHCARCCS